MDQYDKSFIVFIGGVFSVVLVIILALAWFDASMEARSYRKFCSTPVTWWDAMWIDLRIDECNNQ